MKTIYKLLSLSITAILLWSCNPLKDTYNELGPLPAAGSPAVTFSVNLTATTGLYANDSIAKISIPAYLAKTYPTYGDKSNATVTYQVKPLSFKPADSLTKDVSYTLTDSDYLLLPSNTFKDLNFSIAQMLSWLPYKYPTPVANQLLVLTYTFYTSGVTPSAGVPNTINSFVYLNGKWQAIYTLSAAQYTALGRGNFNEITSADLPNLPTLFNNILKSDPQVSATARAGMVEYVNYHYFVSGKSGGDWQRVQALTYDGNNWVTTPTTSATLTFIKTNGTWVADNTVNLTINVGDQADLVTIAGFYPTKSSPVKYGDFESDWSPTDMQTAIAMLLKVKYTSAQANQVFNVTYLAFTNNADQTVSLKYIFDGTNFVLQTM